MKGDISDLFGENQDVTFYAPPATGKFARQWWAWKTGFKLVWYRAAFRYGFWWGATFGLVIANLMTWLLN